jgi:hypothetical protein
MSILRTLSSKCNSFWRAFLLSADGAVALFGSDRSMSTAERIRAAIRKPTFLSEMRGGMNPRRLDKATSGQPLNPT